MTDLGGERETTTRRFTMVLPLTPSVLFAGSYVAGRVTTEDLDPLGTTLLRYLVALAFLVGVARRRGGNVWRIRPRDFLAITLLGASGIVGYHYFFFASLHYTRVANTAIINAFSPVITGLMAASLLRERLRGANYIGLVAAVAGVLVLLTEGRIGRITSHPPNRGDALMLAAVLCWGFYSVILTRLLTRYDVLTLTVYAALAGVALLIPLTALAEEENRLAEISLDSLIAVVYMGLCGSGLGYLLYNRSVHVLGPTRTASVVYGTVPVFVALLAYLFFDEGVSGPMLASGLLIVAGLRLVLR
jgi:drug/metabolite transporter (DMT)-like permease